MHRFTGNIPALIAALLLALHAAPAAGLSHAAGQSGRGADAARFASAVLETGAVAAESLERTASPEAEDLGRDALLLPGAVRFDAAGSEFPSTADAGQRPADDARARTLPIRAPPLLPLR